MSSVLLKKAFFCRSSVTEMPPMPMSHLPACMSGIRVFQVVCTHWTLTPRLSASERAMRDIDAFEVARPGFEGIGLVVARGAHAQLALLLDAVEV